MKRRISARTMSDRKKASDGPIAIRVKEIGQIFHSLDPLPFRERDLDADVEAYVVGWAQELPVASPIAVVVHLPAEEAKRVDAGYIGEAFRHYFTYRTNVLGWELRELFRVGRASALIGIGMLAACVVVGELAGKLLGVGFLGRFFNEGLIILGWVANWRPIQIFLYDWWPIARRRRLLARLAEAKVEVKSY